MTVPDRQVSRRLRQFAWSELTQLSREWHLPALRLLWLLPVADDDARLLTAQRRNPKARPDRRPFWTLGSPTLAYVLEPPRLYLRADMPPADVEKALTVALASLLTSGLREACQRAMRWLNTRRQRAA